MSEVWSNQTEAEEYYPKLAKFILSGEPGPFSHWHNELYEMVVVFDSITLEDNEIKESQE